MTETSRQPVGFIGLGIMGQPMAGHHPERGAPPHRVQPDALEDRGPPGRGAVVASSPAEVAARSTVVITMVTDTPDVEAVVAGRGDSRGDPPGLDRRRRAPSRRAWRRDLDGSCGAGGGARRAPVSGGDGERQRTLAIWRGGTGRRSSVSFRCCASWGRRSPTADRSRTARSPKLANPDPRVVTLLGGRPRRWCSRARTASTRPPSSRRWRAGRPVVAIDKSRPAYYQAGLRPEVHDRPGAEGPPAGPGGLLGDRRFAAGDRSGAQLFGSAQRRFGREGTQGLAKVRSGCRDSSSLAIISIGVTHETAGPVGAVRGGSPVVRRRIAARPQRSVCSRSTICSRARTSRPRSPPGGTG